MAYNKEYHKEYYQKHKEERKEYQRQYSNRPEIKEKISLRGKKYRQRPEVKERNKLQQRKWVENNPQKYCFIYYKSGAKERNLPFNLSFEEFITFWQRPCFYCGDKIETIGIDRVDNTKGYALSNCVPCCQRCNDWKRALSQLDFLNHCKKIALF